MDPKVLKFFDKNELIPQNISYVVREDNKTFIHRLDGSILSTFLPVKSIQEALPQDAFWSITKGVVVNAAQVVAIDECDYSMSDGTIFHGRQRNAAEHHRNRQALEYRVAAPAKSGGTGQSVAERFSVLDHFPAAFFVLELTFNQEHHGVEFTLRYCNEKMLSLLNRSRETLMDQPINSILEDHDLRWFAAYSDVALNGGTKTVKNTYKPVDRIPIDFTVLCYQPMYGYCACALIEDFVFNTREIKNPL